MATQIKIRRDTYANWFNVNPTLGNGEPGYDITNRKLKIGDGITLWRDLSYFDDQVTDLSAYAGSIAPGADSSHDLGSPSNRWQNGFFANGAVYLGDIKLSNNTGTLVVQRVTNAGLQNEAAVPSTPGSVTTDRLTNGANSVSLAANGNLITPAFTIPNTAGTSGQVLKWPGIGTTLVWGPDNNSGTGGSGNYSVSFDEAPPDAPSPGDLWYDPNSGRIYIYYDSYWIDASPTSVGVESIVAGTGLSGGTITSSGTIAIADTTVAAGNYTLANITVNAQGQITSASNGTLPTFATVATSGSYSDLSNQPTIPAAQIQADWTQANDIALDFIKNKPALFDGAYSSLSGKPTLFSGSYDDLSNRPTIPAAYSATSINALSDVDTVTNAPTTGQALVWNVLSSSWVPGTTPTSVSTLSDVIITLPVAGQVLKYNGSSWINDVDAVTGGDGVGTVTNVSVTAANGFNGTVATSSSTPAITITTSITGLLKGNGTAISAAVAGTDYLTSITSSNVTTALGFTPYSDANPNGYITTNGIPSQTGNSGRVLSTDGTTLSWTVVATGSVASVSVVSANGFSGTVATDTTTPAITIATSITGLLKGNGTAISAATSGTDYQAPITLTTSGSSGAATFIGTTLNIPQYTSGATAFSGLSDATSASLTVDQFYLPATTRLNVTNNDASSYRFDQYGTTDNPTIYATNGATIAFNLNVEGHPFLIQTSGGSTYNEGLTHVTTAGVVTTGSSAQGKTSGTLYWKVPTSISGTYRYICSIHGSMAGVITINPVTVTASSVGLGNVTNESKVTMFSSPTFTGTVTAGFITIRSQANYSLGIGYSAGSSNQGADSIAIGSGAGANGQTSNAVAIGTDAGGLSQSIGAVAIGLSAGSEEQGFAAVAIGNNAGVLGQGANSIAIGLLAGSTNQGENSIAIGSNAGVSDQAAGSIGIGTVNPTEAGLYISPIRSVTATTNFLYYDTTSKEITYAGITSSSVGLGNVTNESKATMFTSPIFEGTAQLEAATFTGTVTMQQSVEKFVTASVVAGAVALNFNQAAIFVVTPDNSNFTADFLNIPGTAGRTITTTLIITQGSTAYIPNAVKINGGSSITPQWLGGSEPTGTPTQTEIVSFTFVCTATNTWTVLGSLSTYG